MSFNALIVDDSYLMRSRLSRILEQEPRIAKIDFAEDGQEALDRIKDAEYHIILLDIEMPKMNGMEFLKRSKLHTDAKIIVLSSVCEVGSESAQKAAYFGAFDVARKPKGIFSHEEILHLVFNALKSFNPQQSLAG